MRDTVEGHFGKVINQIEAGLPEVADEEEDGEEHSFSFVDNSKTDWLCPTCTN